MKEGGTDCGDCLCRIPINMFVRFTWSEASSRIVIRRVSSGDRSMAYAAGLLRRAQTYSDPL